VSGCCVFVDAAGFYRTSLGNHSPTEPAEASAMSRDAGARLLDVQPYIISPRHDDDVFDPPPRRPAVVPVEPRLSRHIPVVAKSHDSLDVVGAELRRSPTSHDEPGLTTVSRSSSVRDAHRRGHRRRRRSDVAETSFTESSSTAEPVQLHDIAVQVTLPRRSEAPVPQLPRMGKLIRPAAVPVVCHQKSYSQDSVNALTTESGLGGSMPCLPPAEDGLVPVDDRVRDVLVASPFSTSSSSSPGTGLSSLSVLKTRSHRHLHYDDEGYLTKESTMSTSSRQSPVFF